MPEGHTIHRLARDLRRTLGDHPVRARSPQGRFTEGARAIDGLPMATAAAWGKHLFVEFDGLDDRQLHVHLGLIGKFRPTALDTPERDTIRLRLEGADTAWDLTGPQDCRLIDPAERDVIVDRLGPDPLRRGKGFARFAEALERRRIAIGAALLDQSVVAGIGNVYRAEFLFLIGVDPHRAANSLTSTEVELLWSTAGEQLRQGVRLNRIVTVTRADAGASAGRLQRDDALYVYKRDGLPCRRCGTEVAIGEIAGRSCWWCSRCQR